MPETIVVGKMDFVVVGDEAKPLAVMPKVVYVDLPKPEQPLIDRYCPAPMCTPSRGIYNYLTADEVRGIQSEQYHRLQEKWRAEGVEFY